MYIDLKDNNEHLELKRAGSSLYRLDQLASVAFSGSYNDLSNKPTIPSASSIITDVSNLLYDFYSVQSSDSVRTDGNTKYLLLNGVASEIDESNIINGTRITISFDLQLGIQGVAQAGLTEFNIRLEKTTGAIFSITDINNNPLRVSDFMGAKSITADYSEADGQFYLSGVVYETTDTATNGSSALITSGGVYTILGNIETLLAAI